MEMTMTTAILVLCFTSILVLFWRSFMLPASKLPPGPRPLPIVGNLLMVMKYGSLQNAAVEMKRKYGTISTLWMCSTPMIIISDTDMIQESMITQGSVFMGRPQAKSTSVLNRGHKGLISGDGERPVFFRKLLVSGILSNKQLGAFQPIREKEVDILVESLKKELDDETSGGVVTNFRSIVRLTGFNLLMGALFGRRLALKEYVELDEILVQRFLLALGNPIDFIPWLAWLPDRNGVRVQLEMIEKLSRVLGPLIEERKQALRIPGKNGNLQANLVDTILRVQSGETDEKSIEITDADIELLCTDILNAGMDQNALNLEYCLANLVNHPEIQEKLAREISAVVGERVVNEDDIPRLPYLQAVIKEGLRKHTPLRLTPRRALWATKIAGYDIPKDAWLMVHLEAVALSPQIWEDPLEFRPERHLNKTLDITGSTEITMIPFGLGRRICPAVNMAFLHAELILARLVQAFEWTSTTPGQPLDLSPAEGLSSPMKYPLVARLQERLMVSQISANSV